MPFKSNKQRKFLNKKKPKVAKKLTKHPKKKKQKKSKIRGKPKYGTKKV